MISGSTSVAAVIGSPVRHSLSPAIHNAAFAAAGVDWVYTAFDVAAGGARQALEAMRALGIAGLSVTMPHKHDVADGVDVLAPAAIALHSVNTVVRLADGRLEGHSTDGAGFVASLTEAGIEVAGRLVVVIGAGAAARSVIDAVGRSGAGEIVVVNRTAEHAALAASLAGDVGRVGSERDVIGADIVVNATSIGMSAGTSGGTSAVGATGGAAGPVLPFDASLLRPGQVVADLVYHPLETPLLAAARAAGAITVDGLGMLVHQAALQQLLWLGVHPDAPVMRAAAIDELERRRQIA